MLSLCDPVPPGGEQPQAEWSSIAKDGVWHLSQTLVTSTRTIQPPFTFCSQEGIILNTESECELESGQTFYSMKKTRFLLVWLGEKYLKSSHWILNRIILAKVLAFVGRPRLLFWLATMVTDVFADPLCGRFLGRFDFFYPPCLGKFQASWDALLLPPQSFHPCLVASLGLTINISSLYWEQNFPSAVSEGRHVAVSSWVRHVRSWKIVLTLSHYSVLVGIHDHFWKVNGNCISQFAHYLVQGYDVSKAVISILWLKTL